MQFRKFGWEEDLCGFDGFVDKVKRPAKERRNTKVIYFETTRDFAQQIA